MRPTRALALLSAFGILAVFSAHLRAEPGDIGQRWELFVDE